MWYRRAAVMAGTIDRPLRVGFVGCGSVFMHYGALFNRLRRWGWGEVAFVCDSDSAKAKASGDLFGETPFTTDWHEVVGSETVDVVAVLTSTPFHEPVSRAALEAGKHVLVEKPMAQSLKQAEALVKLARERGLLLAAAPFVVLSPTFQILWKRVRQGDIGQVLLARGRYGGGAPTWTDWYFQGGTNALFELGVYNVITLTALLGPAKRVTAFSGVAVPERAALGKRIESRTPDNTQLLIDFGDNVFASVTTGFTMLQYRSPAIELYGTEGVLQMLGDDWAPEGYEVWDLTTRVWQGFPETDPLWHWAAGLEHLIECLRTGTDLTTTPEHALHAMEIMVRAEEAAADGRAREITSDFPSLQLPADEIDASPRSGRYSWLPKYEFGDEVDPYASRAVPASEAEAARAAS
jgi:predicted dehydrogenase